MERFRNLDWHPALEDIIDNVFIRDDKMEQESTMYRIMNDNLQDPFTNIEEDYADVDIKMIKKYLREDSDVSTEDEKEEDLQKVKHRSNSDIKKPYVPGIRKLPFDFPKRSCLNSVQQAMCLRVLLRLSSNEETKGMTKEEEKEFQQYMIWKEKISSEQTEYLEFAKSMWEEDSKWLIKSNKFVALKWKAKMQRFEELSRFYAESINIPLSIQMINLKMKNIKLTFKSCLGQGISSKVVLPILDKRVTLFMNPATLLNSYPPCITPDKITQHFKLPVSQDIYCENLARETQADFVISSSGLKCLLSNIDPDSNSWLIPVVVKSYQEKNTVYIEKRLPPTIATVPEKNTWVYKYVLRYHIDINSELSEKIKHMKEEKAANHSQFDSDDDSFNNYLKDYEEALSNIDGLEESDNLANDKIEDLSNIDGLEKSDNLANDKIDFQVDKARNVSYNLFTIGPTESLEQERIKRDVKEYQMLVRTKTDGIEMLSNGESSQSVILAPKMEHQLGFGAEAITSQEGLHQWASLKFRPNTSLARVRIAADSADIIQIEKHTTKSLSNEIKRLYNIKVEDSLSILHNIIEGLSSLIPGRYIMRYVPQNGPFACVYKQAENGKNVFDLHTITMCQSKFETTSKTPWPLIDNMMTTPAIRCFQKMPAMFKPKYLQKGRPKKCFKQNADVTDNQVPVSTRRSDRLKKND